METTDIAPSLILGIDAGGTYTDTVLYGINSSQVVSKSKALTTRADLMRGIVEAIDGLDHSLFDRIAYCALSTTLATNALVEGSGGMVGLILLPPPGQSNGALRHDPQVCLDARMGIQGNIIEDLDIDPARACIRSFLEAHPLQAVAISGYASVRNPSHELAAKALVQELCDLPVVCGHELAASLDFTKRAYTAIWNARLLPIIQDLIRSMKQSLEQRGISAPLMIVKGDGTLMPETLALERPIETLLSGPAASIIGARQLSGIQRGTIVDMGGTTTDIAKIKDGQPTVTELGAMVGQWRTSIHAVDVLTTGIGGDSQVWLDNHDRVCVGPRRVIPLCYLAQQYPEIVPELESMVRAYRRTRDFVPPEVLFRVRGANGDLTPDEVRIMAALEERPWLRHRLAARLGKIHRQFLDTGRLERDGSIMVASLTPTDVLHFTGKMDTWNETAAALGVRLFALHRLVSSERMAEMVIETVHRNLALSILSKQLNNFAKGHRLPGCRVCEELVDNLFGRGREDYEATFSLRHPLVAIGAPAGAYFPALKDILGADIIIPEHAEVANAVGAAAADVMVVAECLVRPRNNGVILLHTPRERKEFKRVPEAVAYGREQAIEIARERARASGAADAEPEVHILEQQVASRSGTILLETRIRARVLAPPTFQQRAT